MRLRKMFPMAALTVAACAGLGRTALGKESKMIGKSEIFRKVDALAKVAEVRPASVSSALGVEFAFKKDESVDYMDVRHAKGPKGSWIERVEVRVSKDGSPGGMVLVDVSVGAGVTLDDVLKKYGKEPRISYPSAHEPPDSPLGYIYAQKGQELRFLISRGQPQRVVSVVLDRP